MAAALLLVVGTTALLGVNLSLALGVWGEAVGVPLVAALLAFALIQCWDWLRVKLGGARWPAWRILTGTGALAYVVFFLFPVAYAFLGRMFLIGIVALHSLRLSFYSANGYSCLTPARQS